MTAKTTPDTDEIDSTFQTANDDEKPTPGYATEVAEGTHVSGAHAVTRTFTVERFDNGDADDRLSVYSRYDADGEEVNAQEQTWELDGETVVHSGEGIVEFARSNHYADPQLDIEFAIEADD